MCKHKNSDPIRKHPHDCSINIIEENIEILASTSIDERYLMILEVLWVGQLEPGISTKDEYRSRTLNIKT